MVIIIINGITNLLWIFTTLLVLYTGIYFTVKLNFPQFKFFKIIKSFSNGSKETFKILNLTLAGKIGVGSISGIAICIYTGGISSLFWLWISAFILASLAYYETKIGICYRTKRNNEYVGGPPYYIEKCLNNKKLANIYSILIIITYVIAFISIQTNTIVVSLKELININKIFITIFLIVITYLSIKRGINTISKVTSYLTPIMGIIYMIVGIIVIKNNWTITIEIIVKIITEALSFKSFKTVLFVPFIIGIERGIFSNEAGIGTTAMVTSLSNNDNIEKQANIQIIGTYFTSLIICTITALIILTSNYKNIHLIDINGIEIVFNAFLEHFGYYGIIILILIIFLFAFSTIITSYYYGEVNYRYLFKKESKILKIVVLFVILYSTYMSPTLLWNTVDIFVALISIINCYAMLKISKKGEQQ